MGPWESGARNLDARGIPRNTISATTTPCYDSFRNLNKVGFQVANHTINKK